MTRQRFTLAVNGRAHAVDAAPETPLLYVLRDDLALDGPKFGCGLAQRLRTAPFTPDRIKAGTA